MTVPCPPPHHQPGTGARDRLQSHGARRDAATTWHVLSVHVLGPVEVRDDDAPIELGGPQQRAVVAHLALEAGHVVSVERLIDRLWGDDPPRTPLGTLQSYVSRLRRAIEPAPRRRRRTQGARVGGAGLRAARRSRPDRRAPLHGQRRRRPHRGRRLGCTPPPCATSTPPWRCGVDRRWPASAPTSRCARSWCGSRKSGRPPSKTASKRCWRSVAMPSRCRRCRRRSRNLRYANGSGHCWRWRSTDRAARPTPCGRSQRRARPCSTSSDSTPAPSCASSRTGSSPRTPRCSRPSSVTASPRANRREVDAPGVELVGRSAEWAALTGRSTGPHPGRPSRAARGRTGHRQVDAE